MMSSQKIKDQHFNLFINYYCCYCVLMTEDAFEASFFFPFHVENFLFLCPNQFLILPFQNLYSQLKTTQQTKITKAGDVVFLNLDLLPSTLKRVGIQRCTYLLI